MDSRLALQQWHPGCSPASACTAPARSSIPQPNASAGPAEGSQEATLPAAVSGLGLAGRALAGLAMLLREAVWRLCTQKGANGATTPVALPQRQLASPGAVSSPSVRAGFVMHLGQETGLMLLTGGAASSLLTGAGSCLTHQRACLQSTCTSHATVHRGQEPGEKGALPGQCSSRTWPQALSRDLPESGTVAPSAATF